MYKIILASALALAAFASPAEAHRRHGHRHSHRSTVYVTPWGFTWSHRTRQPRVRISENCVWKPWKNKTVCRY